MSNSFYINCDKLEEIPKINQDNWLFELDLLAKILPPNATVLQVGCMDGTRIIALLRKRLDLKITGLDIEKDLLKIARINLKKAGLEAELIESDITTPQPYKKYTYAVCLNNTLGYITKFELAIKNIINTSRTSIVSVYGEKFSDDVGKAYFKNIGLQVNKIENNLFYTDGFGEVKRFTKNEVESWGGKITETPLGYFCVIE